MKTVVDLASRMKNGDPRKKIDRLLLLSAFICGYYFVYVYQNIFGISIKFFNLKTLIEMPIVAGVILPLIYYTLIKPDPLQRSPWKFKAVRFFQKQFPSKYLLDRCSRCAKSEISCENYLKSGSYDHVRHWFQNILHGEIEKEDPEIVRSTFKKGYNCKLVYYFSWVLIFFLTLSILVLIYQHIYFYVENKTLTLNITPLQAIYPVVCIIIYLIIRILNNPDERYPSGCWQAWQEINGMHISWLKSNETFLTDLICNAKGEK